MYENKTIIFSFINFSLTAFCGKTTSTRKWCFSNCLQWYKVYFDDYQRWKSELFVKHTQTSKTYSRTSQIYSELNIIKFIKDSDLNIFR